MDSLNLAQDVVPQFQPQTTILSHKMMIRKRINWPILVFIFVPVLIVAVDAVVLIGEALQTEEQKAIRLVKESNSRKENFTVQQYLYSTVYHRKRNGETITIFGWLAKPGNDKGAPISVEFSYQDSRGDHQPAWDVSLDSGTVTPKNEAALELSWH
jgi:hypothetical protein